MIAEGELPTRFELPAATLRQIIEKTRFAISSEETRYYLMGIFFHVVDDQMRAAATDGHRLARITVARPDGAEGMPDVIVRANASRSSTGCSRSLRARSKSRYPRPRFASGSAARSSPAS